MKKREKKTGLEGEFLPNFMPTNRPNFKTYLHIGKLEKRTKKKYFVNHRKKTTTWIDPRTKKTRKNDPTQCVIGELPYGWDEELDPEFGVYYINHLHQQNYADPPWDPRIVEQVKEIQVFLDDQIEKQKNEIKNLEEAEQEKIAAAQKRVEELEKEKARIEKELLELRRLAMDDDTDTEGSSDSTSISSMESDLSDQLDDIENELAALGPLTIPGSREEFQKRLEALVLLRNKLLNDPNKPGFDEREEMNKVEEELTRVSAMLENEASTRAALEDQIRKLKEDMENLFKEGDDEPMTPVETIADHMKSKHNQKQPGSRKANLSRKTRYEMEMELLMLKKRLQGEKEEKSRLERLKQKMDSAKGDVMASGKVPDWIKQINQVAASSKTLRVKIGRQQVENPDGLSFRERMLFFAAGSTEPNVKTGVPPPPSSNPNPGGRTAPAVMGPKPGPSIVNQNVARPRKFQ